MSADMSADASNTTLPQRAGLLGLRVATGFLLVWVGLKKLVEPKTPFFLRKYEIAPETGEIIGLLVGGAELLIGVLCVVGLFRRAVLPLQALIHGFTAASVWWAIVDPYRWYIDGVDRIVFNSHVFYPTIITFMACVILILFRRQDRLALDVVMARGKAG